jgi:ATP-dependent Clp protease ATP-binding subunit ClpC
VYSLAAREAEGLGARELGCPMLFVALCKVELLQDDAALQAAGVGDAERTATRQEGRILAAAFEESGFDPVRARRKTRERWLHEQPDPETFGGHRTPACRAVFAGAEARAPGLALLPALLRVLLDTPDDVLQAALADQESAALGLRRALDARLPPAPESGLARFGRDLTRLAREGKLQPAVGRDAEIKQTARILMQAGKSSPILVGDAGVGKTAIVEGLALRLVAPDAPAALRDRTLIEVTPAALMAGTSLRGDLEARVQEIVATAARDPSLILFLDEAHTLLGARGVADLLKPSLARGELSCIAATTPREHRIAIEPDAALARRFQVVRVEEPGPEQARVILDGVRPRLEAHHGVTVGPDAIDAAIELSVRYLPEARLPDKAIDLLDQACTRLLLSTFTPRSGEGQAARSIDRSAVAAVVAERCQVPVEELTRDEAARILALDATLRRRVIGQEQAITGVAETLRAAKAGLRHPERPLGVFLLVGPTGTGKTELARAVAETLFGDERRLIRLDMSEFSQPHQVARLVGSPPGYIGHDEGGQLTEAVRARPHSVVLFDEVEKAHPNAHALFLQIFDQGRLQDGHGRSASFRETVIFLTSNLGAAPDAPSRMGFLASADPEANPEARALEAVRSAFPPELCNRIQKILVFRPLGAESVLGIVDKVAARANRSLAPQAITIELSDAARALLASEGFSPEYGARQLERVFGRLVEEPLARKILEGAVRPGQRVLVDAAQGGVSFSAGPPARGDRRA